jgi:hypothetical protein
MNDKVIVFQSDLDNIYNKHQIVYLKLFDDTPSLISKRNNKSHLKRIKEELRVKLICKSLEYTEIKESIRDNYISKLNSIFPK